MKKSVTPIFFAGVGGCGKTTTAKLLAPMLGGQLAPSRTRDSYSSFKTAHPRFADVIDTSRETQHSSDDGQAAIALQMHIMQQYEQYVCDEIMRANCDGIPYVIFERSPWCHAGYMRETIAEAQYLQINHFSKCGMVRTAHSAHARMMRGFMERTFWESSNAIFNVHSLMRPSGSDQLYQIEDTIVVHLRCGPKEIHHISVEGSDGMRDTNIAKNIRFQNAMSNTFTDPTQPHNYVAHYITHTAFSRTASEMANAIANQVLDESAKRNGWASQG